MTPAGWFWMIVVGLLSVVWVYLEVRRWLMADIADLFEDWERRE